MEMIQTFPAMNGPFASDDEEDPHVTDYSIGKDVIYVAFAWSLAENGHITMFALAEKHNIGFFNASGDAEIYFPVNGKLLELPDSINKKNNSNTMYNKPWWKFGKFDWKIIRPATIKHQQ